MSLSPTSSKMQTFQPSPFSPNGASSENLSGQWLTLCCVLAALLLVRLFSLYFSQIDLFFDEAQYWSWSEELAFGYFSKPPMLAWSIRAATESCGLSEFCIRLPSPILHALAASFIFLTGRALYGAATGLWAAIVYATLPGISYSSGLISTDVPLLLFWSASLFFFVKLLQEKSWIWAIALGLSIGLGLMSKYAMAYFILCAILLCIWHKESRWILTSPKSLIVLLIAALLVTPNILWNIDNGFVTFSHTADNAKWGGPLIHPGKGLEFIAAQFGVFGPILFAALLVIAWRALTTKTTTASSGGNQERELSDIDKMLLTFSLPIIAIIIVQAFISRAHANWAATAYPAAAILVTATMFKDGATKWFKASLALHIAIIAILTVALAYPRATVSTLGLPKNVAPFKRVLGWEEVAQAVKAKDKQGNYAAIITDSRSLISELLFYLREEDGRIKAWKPGRIPHNHFELTRPYMPGGLSRPVLYVSLKKDTDKMKPLSAFKSVTDLGKTKIQTGPNHSRTVRFFALEGYK